MDQFEQDLARMMRDGLEEVSYEDRHRDRLRAGVRARYRVRTAWAAAGSVLTATGLCVALLVLASSFPGAGPRSSASSRRLRRVGDDDVAGPPGRPRGGGVGAAPPVDARAGHGAGPDPGHPDGCREPRRMRTSPAGGTTRRPPRTRSSFVPPSTRRRPPS